MVVLTKPFGPWFPNSFQAFRNPLDGFISTHPCNRLSFNSTVKMTDSDHTYEAVDPTDLTEGDTVIVKDVAEDGETRGDVVETMIEWGRAGIKVETPTGNEVECWEEVGRIFTRIE
jgi:hypothetical protein